VPTKTHLEGITTEPPDTTEKLRSRSCSAGSKSTTAKDVRRKHATKIKNTDLGHNKSSGE